MSDEELNSRPTTPLEYALSYVKLGWHVLPVWGGKDGKCKCRRICPQPGKHPVSQLVPHGQADATTDEATIRRWWAAMPDAGIAVFLKPSGLMAIDLDPRNGGIETMDAIEAKHGKITSDVLAFTQSGGEHRVFSIPDGIALPGKLGAGVDIKLQGYIVVEPTHGVKGVYAWEASSDPLEGAIPSPLPDWMLDLSSPSALAGGEVITGTRHITDNQSLELRDALTYIPADERDMWIKLGMALHSVGQAGFTLWDEWAQKSSKYNPVDSIRVWRSFKTGSGLNYESVFFIAQEHGFINVSQPVEQPTIPAASVQIAPPPVLTFTPQTLLTPPGILGTITQWINATSRKQQPQFAVQAALAFAATVMGRRYRTCQNNYSSLYFINIGLSGSGKEHAKWVIERLLETCNLPHLIGPAGYTSAAGLLSTLHTQPSHIGIIDEFGKMLEDASVNGNSMAKSTLTSLMECWGRCDGAMRPKGYSTAGMSSLDAKKITERTVCNPALTILGMATPDTFFESIGSASARDGFLNRFIIVESEIGRMAGKPVAHIEVPKSVIEWAEGTTQFDGLIDPGANPSLRVTPKVIRIMEEAQTLFTAFEEECIESMNQHDDSGMAEMFSRCCEQSMRLALIVAVGDGWQAINAEHSAWAIEYIRYYAHRAVERISTSVHDSEFAATKGQVLDLIRKSGVRGLTERDLNKSSRKFKSLDHIGQMRVLNSLSFVGDVARVEIPTPSGRGNRKAWVATGDNAADIISVRL